MSWNPSEALNVRVNDLVQFKYNGGTHPGVERVVRVRSVDAVGFGGNDVYGDHDNFRRFDFGKVYDFKLLRREVAPKNEVKFDGELGVVLTNKNGDYLSLAANNNTVAASYHKNGTTSAANQSVAFTLPSSNDQLFDRLVSLLKQFSQ